MSGIAKAQFQRLDAAGTPSGPPIGVQFNPTEYTLNKAAQIAEVTIPGLDAPILQFVRGQTETLTLDLFFDTTEQGMGSDATPVTSLTDQFYQLLKIESATHAPPICLFSWGGLSFPGHSGDDEGRLGTQQRYSFKCVVESVRQRYTLFNPDGVPLRATLSVTLREYKSLKEQVQQLNLQSPDHTHTHVVQRGDTLSRIANTVYGDSRQWRAIADFNQLDDPLDLAPGRVLQIPPIR